MSTWSSNFRCVTGPKSYAAPRPLTFLRHIKVFEMQTAALRYELGDHHTYDFIEGSIPHPTAPEIEDLFPGDEEFFTYFDATSSLSCRTALDDLEAYITAEGPFDAVMAFSQGASLAATLMVRQLQREPANRPVQPFFKCAVFFSGGIPADPATLPGEELRPLDYATDGEVIHVPTAHIYGSNDQQYPTFGPVLSKLCDAKMRTVFVHEGGHEVPGTRLKDAVSGAVNAIRKAVDMALTVQ
ncbi:MAG: hypothetical protein M1837_007022 [Sclerophora amabilis]|nr:MAG: hypothetical protein M1837_007022 [Sclerophora amabilis]